MNRLARTVTVASTLSLVLLLSNCSSFDPTDIMDNMFASQKKPLPGERKPVFPQGSRGFAGLPPELVKGYQPPPAEPATQDAQAAADRPQTETQAQAEGVERRRPPDRSSAPAAAMRGFNPTGGIAISPWPDPPPSQAVGRTFERRTDRLARSAGARHGHAVGSVGIGSDRRERAAHSHPRIGGKRSPSSVDMTSRSPSWDVPECRQVDPVQSAGRPPPGPGRRPARRHPRSPRGPRPARRPDLHGDRHRRPRAGRARQLSARTCRRRPRPRSPPPTPSSF